MGKLLKFQKKVNMILKRPITYLSWNWNRRRTGWKIKNSKMAKEEILEKVLNILE